LLTLIAEKPADVIGGELRPLTSLWLPPTGITRARQIFSLTTPKCSAATLERWLCAAADGALLEDAALLAEFELAKYEARHGEVVEFWSTTTPSVKS
jgi:hypothetical protein